MNDRETEGLLRRLAPQVLGALVRRYGHLDLAEDAVQEALVAAVSQWSVEGIPDSPRAWLITVASRRLTDLLRAEQARRRREETVAGWLLEDDWLAPAADRYVPAEDDTLVLLLMCCHAVLDPSAQVALTLRAVGGLTTKEIARAFLVPEATMTRRITRAKQRIKSSGEPFAMPRPEERAGRVAAALHVLYLIFNEGYSSTSGPGLYRADLSGEAIRLTRMVQRLLPGDSEAAGLLALMLLTEARRPARMGPAGQLIPMAEQDRSLWNAEQITEGIALVTGALTRGPIGPYQLQAAVAAVHDEAPNAEATDWPQIKALYELQLRISDNPVVSLNHAVAVAMVEGPDAGLARLAALQSDDRMAQDHRLHAVRGHLLEKAGDLESAKAAYESAAARTTSVPLRRYLHGRAARSTVPAIRACLVVSMPEGFGKTAVEGGRMIVRITVIPARGKGTRRRRSWIDRGRTVAGPTRPDASRITWLAACLSTRSCPAHLRRACETADPVARCCAVTPPSGGPVGGTDELGRRPAAGGVPVRLESRHR